MRQVLIQRRPFSGIAMSVRAVQHEQLPLKNNPPHLCVFVDRGYLKALLHVTGLSHRNSNGTPLPL